MVDKIVEVEDENYEEYMQACYDLNRLEEFDYHAYQQIDNELSAHKLYSGENKAASTVYFLFLNHNTLTWVIFLIDSI